MQLTPVGRQNSMGWKLIIRAIAQYHSGVRAISVEQNKESIKMIALGGLREIAGGSYSAPVEAREGIRHHW
jgi:hypothetical protein